MFVVLAGKLVVEWFGLGLSAVAEAAAEAAAAARAGILVELEVADGTLVELVVEGGKLVGQWVEAVDGTLVGQ